MSNINVREDEDPENKDKKGGVSDVTMLVQKDHKYNKNGELIIGDTKVVSRKSKSKKK